ncbi:DUF397 domain-containing protein [Streptomyces syringium]|uniref:DUF397 domain-containing protein n=1 Tax=Streptomyces syringium TaxID=76729 RepID=UPI003455FEFF
MHDGPSAIAADAWFKSSYSGAGTTECVETAFRRHHTTVRDSKDPTRATLAFPHGAWADFVGAIRMGRLG